MCAICNLQFIFIVRFYLNKVATSGSTSQMECWILMSLKSMCFNWHYSLFANFQAGMCLLASLRFCIYKTAVLALAIKVQHGGVSNWVHLELLRKHWPNKLLVIVPPIPQFGRTRLCTQMFPLVALKLWSAGSKSFTNESHQHYVMIVVVVINVHVGSILQISD